jgi:hypothetical protein
MAWPVSWKKAADKAVFDNSSDFPDRYSFETVTGYYADLSWHCIGYS